MHALQHATTHELRPTCIKSLLELCAKSSTKWLRSNSNSMLVNCGDKNPWLVPMKEAGDEIEFNADNNGTMQAAEGCLS